MEAVVLKSFTYKGLGGNKAGVVILENEMTEAKMQSIATELGFSETAFVKKVDEKNYDVRFFTPVCEVDLCGHATIAAFYYVGENLIENKSENYKLYQNTKAGKLEIIINFNENKVENVLMEQASPVFYGCVDEKEKSRIAKSLGLDIEDIRLDNYNIEPNIVSTGLKDILIPVKDRQTLNRITPNFELISDISKSNDVGGYHVFTFDDGQIFARNFAPLVGINEECATGTSNGALGALLYKEGIKEGYFEVLQGEAMNELSQICVNVDSTGVKVGGKAEIL